jgi:hypothetical protein
MEFELLTQYFTHEILFQYNFYAKNQEYSLFVTGLVPGTFFPEN